MEIFQTQLAIAAVFIIVGIFILPVIFFFISQQNLLKLIQPQNRFMSPGEVWLQLIPIFGLVWQFIVVTRISDSIKKELWKSDFSFEEQGYLYNSSGGERPAYNIGIAYCILFCCGIIPCVGALCTLAGIVCWIIYWVKISEFKREIEQKNNNAEQTFLPGNNYSYPSGDNTPGTL